MGNTIASLRRKIASAGELQAVVRTMKALAGSNIRQYEQAASIVDSMVTRTGHTEAGASGAVVFGSDHGLVGRFNEVVAAYASKALAAVPGKAQVWAVGERVHARLADAGLPMMELFAVPNSAQAITPLVGQILMQSDARPGQGGYTELHLFYNRPASGAAYAPVSQRLLPLEADWRRQLADRPWPTTTLPEVMSGTGTLRALIREYLFISLFRACAESLASENASRLAAMQRADKNIDEELFDVVSGFEALSGEHRRPAR